MKLFPANTRAHTDPGWLKSQLFVFIQKGTRTMFCLKKKTLRRDTTRNHLIWCIKSIPL